MSFTWAEPYPELHKNCVLFERYELLNPLKWSYHPLQSYLQNGPQCGLVALAMLMGNPFEEIVNKIFDYAKKLEFTINGEIFSANFMSCLAEEFLVNRTIELYSGSLNESKIKDFLLSGGHMLVPYDTNKDNSPGIHKGHKAHWCAVSGAIETEEELFVLAKHGKARNVAIWKLENLAISNQQIFEFSPDRKLQNLDYKLPEGGVAGPMGLNGFVKFVIQTLELCCPNYSQLIHQFYVYSNLVRKQTQSDDETFLMVLYV